MSEILKIAIAQANFCVGDILGNSQIIIQYINRAQSKLNADVVIFPELAITGYPPEDLILRPELHRQVKAALDEIASKTTGIFAAVGYPERENGRLYNSCALIHDGSIVSNYRKKELPNYSVFDEKRYFCPGENPCVANILGFKVGLSICEDIWNPETAQQAKEAGAEIIFNINASPYHIGKPTERVAALSRAANAAKLPIVYVNCIGGQDELVFDGASFTVDELGNVVSQEPAYKESLSLIIAKHKNKMPILSGTIGLLPDRHESIYQSIVLGIKDYVEKNNFPGCIIGLSGGIDSALTLSLAADALGAERIAAISMPSKFTAQISIDDARQQTELLNCVFQITPIHEMVDAFEKCLNANDPNKTKGVTGENIQARVRGIILMAESNATGKMVLTTGNKSEVAVGYSTLYGDMVGGFAPLKDIPKTLVFELAKWRNAQSYVIPSRVIERPPSAELAPDQKDSDSLPSYDLLDQILELYIECDKTPEEISLLGFELSVVEKIASMVNKNEYKRRQSAPCVRVTTRAFGRDRRFPITSKYKETGGF
jgi:NAD+ synthase (glutamine-hydrolysing)